jgi:hypothetical protein
VQAEQNKLAQELLSKKQEKAEERFYKHKAEILEKEKQNISKQIILTNKCNKYINIAVNFTALNDIEETRGWRGISAGETIKPSYFIRSGTIYIHAETTDSKYKLKGKHLRQKYAIESHFDYIADDLTILLSGSQERISKKFQLEDFYRVDFAPNGVTTKTFTCTGDNLELS